MRVITLRNLVAINKNAGPFIFFFFVFVVLELWCCRCCCCYYYLLLLLLLLFFSYMFLFAIFARFNSFIFAKDKWRGKLCFAMMMTFEEKFKLILFPVYFIKFRCCVFYSYLYMRDVFSSPFIYLFIYSFCLLEKAVLFHIYIYILYIYIFIYIYIYIYICFVCAFVCV